MAFVKHGKLMSLERFLIDFHVGLVILSQIYQAASLENAANCEVLYTCAECIRTPACGWCSQLKPSNLSGHEGHHCMALGKINQLCTENKFEAPEAKIRFIKNEEVREDRGKSTVQLQPQEVHLTLRMGEPYTIDLKFKKANDYPIDLYYLLDFSKSMHSYKTKLSDLGIKLAKEMEKRTTKLQLGFGSFVDKVTLPYTNTHPDALKSPCSGCVSPYSFKNHMPLTNNTKSFPEKLRIASMSGNEDSPEGGLDGLLQTMVCWKEINWRPNARRIIVFCTDALFHIAGDGKLGGVVEPHDGMCHLDSSGDYTHSLIYDYPSISLINEKARENSMNIVFAVNGTKKSVTRGYESLRNAIEGSSLGVLKDDDTIVNLVLEHYNRMSLSIALTENATASTAIKFHAKCPGTSWWKDSGSCSALKAGDEVLFRATIEVLDCSHPEQIVEIKPIGIVESMIVHISVQCQCLCEDPSHSDFELKAKSCALSGNLTCGRCVCPETHYGRNCECQRRDLSRQNLLRASDGCKRGNVICSKRGTCICGTCRCDQPNDPDHRVYGDFCECDNFSCPFACFGRGQCLCGGHCHCDEGWTGPDCNCPTDASSCISTSDFSLCSNHGDCVCGKCRCHATGKHNTTYSGKFCERCTDCKVNCTSHMHDCVDCLAFGAGPYAPEKCANCTGLFQQITVVSSLSGMQNFTETSILCTPLETDEKGCSFQYVPFYEGESLSLHVEEKKTCPTPVNAIAISAGVAGSIVAAGIILVLIWKLFTTIHDKREYEKFETQRANTQWGRGDNPLYRKALTTHINPAFEGYTEKSGTQPDSHPRKNAK